MAPAIAPAAKKPTFLTNIRSLKLPVIVSLVKVSSIILRTVMSAPATETTKLLFALLNEPVKLEADIAFALVMVFFAMLKLSLVMVSSVSVRFGYVKVHHC